MLLAVLLVTSVGAGAGCSTQHRLNPNFNRFNQRVDRVAQMTHEDAMEWAAFFETLTPERIAAELEDAGRQAVSVVDGAGQLVRQDWTNGRRRFRSRVDRAVVSETRRYERAPDTLMSRLELLIE